MVFVGGAGSDVAVGHPLPGHHQRIQQRQVPNDENFFCEG